MSWPVTADVEIAEVQALALCSYRNLGLATYLPLRTAAGGNLGAWLAEVVPTVTVGRPESDTIEAATNVAFSHDGLRALGLEPQALGAFSAPFREGMAASSHRSWGLGDVGDSSPEQWAWGTSATAVDAVLLLYAKDRAQLERLVATARARAVAHRLALVTDAPLESAWPRASSVAGTREHFGFVDGVSQPRIPLAADEAVDWEDGSVIAAGELLLGYANESGALAPGPTVAATPAALRAGLPAIGQSARRDLGRNGTYLVFRQLEQDVIGFWRFVEGQADAVGSVELCAAKLMGRWRNGAPLTLEPSAAGSLGATPAEKGFRFRHHGDETGSRCPLGAHIRRANPRDTLPGLAERASLAAVRRHRLLRRGRPYGPPVDGWPDPHEILARNPAGGANGAQRGMHFLCLNADIAQQFEHVQQRWLNDPTFVSVPNDEVDPIVGRPRPTTRFLIPSKPAAVLLGENGSPWTRFVRVRGGAYLFLPSRSALGYLAALQGRGS